MPAGQRAAVGVCVVDLVSPMVLPYALKGRSYLYTSLFRSRVHFPVGSQKDELSPVPGSAMRCGAYLVPQLAQIVAIIHPIIHPKDIVGKRAHIDLWRRDRTRGLLAGSKMAFQRPYRLKMGLAYHQDNTNSDVCCHGGHVKGV